MNPDFLLFVTLCNLGAFVFQATVLLLVHRAIRHHREVQDRLERIAYECRQLVYTLRNLSAPGPWSGSEL